MTLMKIILAFAILFTILLILSDRSDAAGALESVKIIKGVSQIRPQQTPQTLGRRYIWNFESDTYTILMLMDVERYNSYGSRDRNNFPKMVEEGTDALQDLIAEFSRVLSSFNEEKKAGFVLAFVQSLPYTYDDVTTGHDEFRRYAVETLMDGGGDCEDTSVLAASILSGLGFKIALITFPDHIALGVKGDFSGTYYQYGGESYYYCETTGTGWRLGDLPLSYRDQRASIMPIEPRNIDINPEEVSPVKPPEPKPVTPTPVTPAPITTRGPESGNRVAGRVKSSDNSEDDSAAAVVFTIIILILLSGIVAFILIARALHRDPEVASDDLTQSKRSSSDPLDKV